MMDCGFSPRQPLAPVCNHYGGHGGGSMQWEGATSLVGRKRGHEAVALGGEQAPGCSGVSGPGGRLPMGDAVLCGHHGNLSKQTELSGNTCAAAAPGCCWCAIRSIGWGQLTIAVCLHGLPVQTQHSSGASSAWTERWPNEFSTALPGPSIRSSMRQNTGPAPLSREVTHHPCPKCFPPLAPKLQVVSNIAHTTYFLEHYSLPFLPINLLVRYSLSCSPPTPIKFSLFTP